MNYEQYQERLREVRRESEIKQRELLIEYALANNNYKIGDVFTDHIGSVLIEKIKTHGGASYDKPCCVYFGLELKKDGTPRKDLSKRDAYQSNDVNKS